MKDFYSNLNYKLKNNNGLVRTLRVLDKAIVLFTAIVYILYLIYLILCILRVIDTKFNYDLSFLLANILVPACSFLIVSWFRKLVNAKRPYEVCGFEPLLLKDTKGKSFPSRHVFSIFIISMVFYYAGEDFILLSIMLFALGVILGIIRVLGGVHFIRDVLAGAIIGILCGCMLALVNVF